MNAGLIVLTLLVAAALPARAEMLARRPYLQTLTPSSVIVVWTTDVAAGSEVRYGIDPTNLALSASVPGSVTQHEVKVTGLLPDTRYYYSVGSTGNVLAGADARHYFVTAPTVGTPRKFRSWIVGDGGTGGTTQAQVRDAMLTFVGAARPQLFLHMGDMAYDTGTTTEFTNKFFAPYATVLENTPVWPTMGNHEGASSDSGTQIGPYYTAYVLPRAAEAGGLASGTEAYYSFDHANVHFIVLDSHDSPRTTAGAMLTWLKSDLTATSQPWIIAFWHHPAYTKGSHDSDTESQLIQMRENALPILEAGGVDLVLAGHSHIYERSFLLDGAYATPTTAAGHIVDSGDGKPLGSGPYHKLAGRNGHDGAVYIVAGHSGAGVSGAGDHPVMYFSEVANGSCILDVQDNRLSVVNIRRDGKLTDHFSLVKGDALVLAAPDGGEKLIGGMPFTIRWATVGTVASVALDYSVDDGRTWVPITASTANTGSYGWTVPSVNTTTALVRVRSTQVSSLADESNAIFSISSPSTSDGGLPPADLAGADLTGADLTGTGATDDGGGMTGTPPGRGCGCAVGARDPARGVAGWAGLLGAAALLLVVASRRRRRTLGG